MKTIKAFWNALIHSINSLLSRIWGHNTKVSIGGQELSINEVEKMIQENMGQVDCKVCGGPLVRAWGQNVKYHAYCRKFRHNKVGFNPDKVTI